MQTVNEVIIADMKLETGAAKILHDAAKAEWQKAAKLEVAQDAAKGAKLSLKQAVEQLLGLETLTPEQADDFWTAHLAKLAEKYYRARKGANGKVKGGGTVWKQNVSKAKYRFKALWRAKATVIPYAAMAEEGQSMEGYDAAYMAACKLFKDTGTEDMAKLFCGFAKSLLTDAAKADDKTDDKDKS